MTWDTDTLFENLYAEHYKTVYQYVLVSLRFDRNLTDDCMQDIFMLLLQKKDILTGHPNPGGFFIITARNYINKYRAALAYKINTQKPLAENTAALRYEENFNRLFEAQVDIEALKDEVLSQLSEEETALYTLFYEQKRSGAEIARHLHITENNVRVRLYRLKIKVKNIIRALF